MERQKKIVDASIAVKWFVEEEGSEKALSLRNEHINGSSVLIVPDLFFIEVINAFRYKTKNKEFLKKVNDDLWKIQLKVQKINQYILDKASEIALDYDMSIYDSIYVALSQIYGCPIYTSDKKLAEYENAVKI